MMTQENALEVIEYVEIRQYMSSGRIHRIPHGHSITTSTASRHTRGPLDNMSFGAPVWHWDKHFSVWIIVFRYFAVPAGWQVGLGILQEHVEPRLHRHKREKVATMTVAISHVLAVPAQCHAHHVECHNNVYGPDSEAKTFTRRSPLS